MNRAAAYRLVWRWHFYAGLVIAPFIFILSVSGLVYLFNDEINDFFQADKRFVEKAMPSLPLDRIAEIALGDYPAGKVTRIDTPRSSDRSIEVFVTTAADEAIRVFVDPGMGDVLGSHNYYHTLVGLADQLHGSLFLGEYGDAVVELAACWGLILIVTGVYLWWPRGEMSIWRALFPNWRMSGRALWRSLHASIGLWTSALAIFLVLTGLPWATVWGGLFRQATEIAGIGYPTSFRGYGTPASETVTIGSEAGAAAPWTLAEAPAPRSAPHGSHGHHTMESALSEGVPVGLNRVAAILAENGMQAPYRLSLPKGASGVYVAFTYPDRPQGQRSLYIDQYSGRVLGDVSFADYGIAAKAIELGIQLHMGNYFGRLNQVVMAIPCIGLILLSLTGPYMWWRRRPAGELGAPRELAPAPMRAIALITIVLAVFFPLAGASLILIGLIDRSWAWARCLWPRRQQV